MTTTRADDMTLPCFRSLLPALLVLLALGCERGEQPADTSTKVGLGVTESASGDSCPPLAGGTPEQYAAREPDDTMPPPPHLGSWNDSKRVRLDSFSLTVPTVASGRPLDAHGSYWISDFPSCRYHCSLEITFTSDSTAQGLDAYVKRLQTVDSTAGDDALDWMPGPARATMVNGQRGVLMDTPCGDCTAAELLVYRNSTIARVAYSIDDRERITPALQCHLTRVATSFRWEGP